MKYKKITQTELASHKNGSTFKRGEQSKIRIMQEIVFT
jgi:hypothetical protein